jgi:hypothetical protein
MKLKNTQIWTIDGNVVYALTNGGTVEEFDSSLPIMYGMIDSFQIIPQSVIFYFHAFYYLFGENYSLVSLVLMDLF